MMHLPLATPINLKSNVFANTCKHTYKLHVSDLAALTILNVKKGYKQVNEKDF